MNVMPDRTAFETYMQYVQKVQVCFIASYTQHTNTYDSEQSRFQSDPERYSAFIKAITDVKTSQPPYVVSSEANVIKIRNEVKKIFVHEPDLLEEFDSLFAHMVPASTVIDGQGSSKDSIARNTSGDIPKDQSAED